MKRRRNGTSQSNRKHANAANVLPSELIEQIQNYYFDGTLWIPSPDNYYDSREMLVHELRAKGVSTKEIAELAMISVRRVQQILSGPMVIDSTDGDKSSKRQLHNR